MRSFRKRGSDERRAMFANMMNGRYHSMARFADEPVSENLPAVIAEKPIVVKTPESSIEGISYKTDIIPHGEVLPVEVPVIEEVKIDPIEFMTGLPLGSPIADIKPEVSADIPKSVAIGFPLRQTNEGPKSGSESGQRMDFVPSPEMEYGSVKPETLILEGDFTKADDSVGGRAYDEFFKEMKAGYGSARENLEQEIIAKAGQYGRDIGSGKMEWDFAKGVVRAPGKVLGATGKSIKKLHLPQQAEKYLRYGVAVAAPAAAAFGKTAGVGVTDLLAEGTDLIKAPGREFFMPPGYQRVWTGMGDNYQMARVDTPQMQPAHIDMNMGMAMPPGVYANPMDISEAASGMKGGPIFRGIDDREAKGEISMGTVKAGEAFERRQSVPKVRSPKERVAKMNIFEAGKAFMEGGKGSRMRDASKVPLTGGYEKSDKQKSVEAIMSLSTMDAAKAFETGAKVEIVSSKPKPRVPVYGVPKSYVPRAPISMEIPVSSTTRHEDRPKVGSVSIPGAGGAVNRYIHDRAELERARSAGNIGAADRAEAKMQSGVGGLQRSSTPEAAAVLAGIRGGR